MEKLEVVKENGRLFLTDGKNFYAFPSGGGGGGTKKVINNTTISGGSVEAGNIKMGDVKRLEIRTGVIN